MATAKKKGASGGKRSRSRNDRPTSQPPNLDEVSGSTPRAAINRILSDEDESEVVEWIDRWLNHGFLLDNQKQVSAFARYFMKISNHPSKDVGVSDEFYEGLFRRIPSVKWRVQAARKACKSAKLKNEGREVKAERLAEFPAFLRDLQWLLEIPSQHHYVFGDTGFMTAINSEHQDLCIEASTRDEPEYRRITSAIICACHDGRFLSPYMISKTTAVNQNRMVYRSVSTSFAARPWANAEFFLDWIERVFEKETKSTRVRGLDAPARLLLVDGIRYGITPAIFMSCWNKGIYLVCIPPKGSSFFNPLECGVFAEMHKIYADEAATKYRNEKSPFILSPQDVTDFMLRHLHRNLLKIKLANAWTKTHLYSRDEESLRKYVKGTPATPAPVTPAKVRSRPNNQPQVVQDEPMPPPRSSQQPGEIVHARRPQPSSVNASERADDAPQRAQRSGSRNRYPTAEVPRRGPRLATLSPAPVSPPRAQRLSQVPQIIEITDDENHCHVASVNLSAHDEDFGEGASSRKQVGLISRVSTPSRQRSRSESTFYGMSGALLETPNRQQHYTGPPSPSVEIITTRTSLPENLNCPGPEGTRSSDSDDVLDTTENTWTGPGLENAYKMQILALSDPKTPDSERRSYEQKLLALAPILSGFAPDTVNALQALAKACSAKLQGQVPPSRLLTPQTSKKTKVCKTNSSKQHRPSSAPRGPRRRPTHRFF